MKKTSSSSRRRVSTKAVSGKEVHLVRATIMGERGQVVIPKEIRDRAGLKAGSRLMVMHHQTRGPVVLMPMEHMQDFMEQMVQQMKDALR